MSRPQKVLHVMNSAGGGAALSTLGLIEALKAEGIRSCAVCHDAGNQQERDQLLEAVDGAATFTRLYWWNRKIRMPLWRRPLAEIKQILLTGWARGSTNVVADFATKHSADLIHTNTILTPEGGLAARRLGLPHVWHLREMLGPGNPFRLYREGAAFGRYMRGHCDKLIANSHASAAFIRGWIDEDLLEIVPNGIDISRFSPRADKQRGEKLVVAMVGNLTSRWKKHDLFVNAATRVDPSLPIEWRIYGHDPSRGGTDQSDSYMNGLHEIIARGRLADRFVWPGFVADPVEIMKEIDILVHPADHESFGRVVVEAMAAGLPVVGVRGGGVAEIVQDGTTGLLGAPDNSREMAEHIKTLAHNPQLRRSMGTAGRQRAESTYSLTACVAAVVRVYEAAMARGAGQARSHSAAVAAATH